MKFQNLKYQEAIAQVEETSEVAEAESRLPQGTCIKSVEERTAEEAEEPIPRRLSLSKKPFRKT